MEEEEEEQEGGATVEGSLLSSYPAQISEILALMLENEVTNSSYMYSACTL